MWNLWKGNSWKKHSGTQNVIYWSKCLSAGEWGKPLWAFLHHESMYKSWRRGLGAAHTTPRVCQQQRGTLGQWLWGKASQSTNPGFTNENLNTVLLICHSSPSTSSEVRWISIPWRWCWRRIPMLGAETRMQGRTGAWCKHTCAEPQSAPHQKLHKQ